MAMNMSEHAHNQREDELAPVFGQAAVLGTPYGWAVRQSRHRGADTGPD
jgi:hypothetical protein